MTCGINLKKITSSEKTTTANDEPLNHFGENRNDNYLIQILTNGVRKGKK